MSDAHNSVTVLGSNLAHLMLIQERTKLGVKKSDINRLVLQGNSENRTASSRLFKDVLDEANRMLEQSLGYKIVEVPGKSVFIVVNTLSLGNVARFLEKEPEWAEIRGLLSVILSLIVMSGGEIREEELWSFLDKLNVARDDKNHETFGDVEKLVKTTLVKSHYLLYSKEKNAPSSFRWGVRSEHEFNKMQLLNFVASIYDDGRTACDFTDVHKKLVDEEAEAAARTAQSFTESSQAEEDDEEEEE